MNDYKDDEIFRRFIGYMKISLHREKLYYLKKYYAKRKNEISIEEVGEIISVNPIQSADLSKLSTKEQYVLKKIYLENLSYKQLADITNEKIETLRKRRNRAIKKLRNEEK